MAMTSRAMRRTEPRGRKKAAQMLEQPSAIRSGLFTTNEAPVPLAGVTVDAEISSFCGRVVITQRYVNREATPIEAVYVFPLDEGAAVCGFEATIDGTLVVGEVKEREEAFRMYDDAIERGDGGFLLDEERPDVFQANVGNLPPGKDVLLRLTYVTELAVDGSGLRFTIPTTVSPRFAPAEDHCGVGRSDAESLNPPVAWRVPYGLGLSVRLAMPGSISRVESPSHPVAVAMNGHEATVTLSQREAALDRDFVLSVEAAGLDVPQAWIERDEGDESAVAVGFIPRLDHATVPNELIFLVDRSGSMDGTSIDEVRNALQLCLRSMVPGCRFNIVSFGSTFQPLFPENRSYDETSLEQASTHVAGLQADLGGTEILPALQFVLQQPPQPGLARQVVVLTDGQVTNTDAVLRLASAHAASARIFTFGIGAGASHHLVKGLARAGGGTAEFIYPGERIEPKVVRQFGRLLSPAVTDVQLAWGGLAAIPAPVKVPPVFAGGRLVIYAFVKNLRHTTVRLTATMPSGTATFEVHVDPARATVGRAVGTLAARARIRELEESPEWIASRGSRQKARKESSVTQEIVALSIRYGLVSRETSYVAVERRDTPVHGDMKLRRVPVALTHGWGGLQNGTLRRASLHQVTTAGMPDAASTHDAFSFGAMPARAARIRLDMPSALSARAERAPGAMDRPGELLSRPVPPSASSTRRTQVPPGFHAVVKLQRADGSWDLTSELAGVIGRDVSELEAALKDAPADEVRRAWATALALVWLATRANEIADEWELLAHKATEWLDAVAPAAPGETTWMQKATLFLFPQNAGGSVVGPAAAASDRRGST
jgi:Ca-activated chloride channel homolog